MKKEKISLCFNIIITILTIVATFIMFTGIKFMHGNEIVLETTKLGMFKFFTVDSNIFMGIVALIFSIYEIKLIKGKINEIPTILYKMKLASTTAVTLTFGVVFAYLGPIVHGGIKVMLMNSNLFFHLIIPVLSIITFIFFERCSKLKSKDAFVGLIPTFLYSVFYLTNIIIHTKNGKVSPVYDWYLFVQKGVIQILIICPLIYLITYIISYILYKINNKKVV